MDVINFVSAHWTEIGAVLGYAVAAAHAIIAITGNTSENAALAKVVSVLNSLGFHIPE